MKLDPGHPELEPQQELRDPRTGLLWFPPEPTKELPEGSTTVAIKNGLTVGLPDEESMDRLRHNATVPALAAAGSGYRFRHERKQRTDMEARPGSG